MTSDIERATWLLLKYWQPSPWYLLPLSVIYTVVPPGFETVSGVGVGVGIGSGVALVSERMLAKEMVLVWHFPKALVRTSRLPKELALHPFGLVIHFSTFAVTARMESCASVGAVV